VGLLIASCTVCGRQFYLTQDGGAEADVDDECGELGCEGEFKREGDCCGLEGGGSEGEHDEDEGGHREKDCGASEVKGRKGKRGACGSGCGDAGGEVVGDAEGERGLEGAG
jgi:hypothetical protein